MYRLSSAWWGSVVLSLALNLGLLNGQYNRFQQQKPDEPIEQVIAFTPKLV